MLTEGAMQYILLLPPPSSLTLGHLPHRAIRGRGGFDVRSYRNEKIHKNFYSFPCKYAIMSDNGYLCPFRDNTTKGESIYGFI